MNCLKKLELFTACEFQFYPCYTNRFIHSTHESLVNYKTMKEDIMDIIKNQQDLSLLKDMQRQFKCHDENQVLRLLVILIGILSVLLTISVIINCKQTKRVKKYKYGVSNTNFNNTNKQEAHQLLTGENAHQYFAIVED